MPPQAAAYAKDLKMGDMGPTTLPMREAELTLGLSPAATTEDKAPGRRGGEEGGFLFGEWRE